MDTPSEAHRSSNADRGADHGKLDGGQSKSCEALYVEYPPMI